jgi:glycosyltransferase involved in cell wall biosynthesis
MMSSGEKNKRILVVCQHFWPESFRINDIVDYFLEKGYEIDVLCGRPNYPSGKLTEGYTLWNRRIEKYGDATVYRSFEIPRGDNSNLRIFLNYISFPISSLFHAPRLMTKKYDEVLIYQLSPVMMSIAGIIIGKIRKIETTMYVLDLWPENLFSVLDIKKPFLRKIAAKVSHWHYKKADKLVVLSKAMKDNLLQVTRKQESQITIIPQAAEKLYETSVDDEKLKRKFKETFNIVFTGNISPAQSFPTMIEAANIIKEKGFDDIRWIIVGDGMSRKDTEKEISARGLDTVFTFEGHKPISDMPKYTGIADVLVGCLVKSNLLEATIPAKVMSYIASGKPIVLAMDGEVQDLINNEIKCGFAGNTEDAQSLADNILKVYHASSAERQKMGNSASTYHFKHFERNLLLKRLEDFIFTGGQVK